MAITLYNLERETLSSLLYIIQSYPVPSADCLVGCIAHAVYQHDAVSQKEIALQYVTFRANEPNRTPRPRAFQRQKEVKSDETRQKAGFVNSKQSRVSLALRDLIEETQGDCSMQHARV